MSRRCEITGKGVMTGNNVSHAKNRSRRRFLPNLQKVSLMSDTLKTTVSLRVCTRAIRTIEFHGGLDAYLNSTPNRNLTETTKRLKKMITKVAEAAKG